jgi:hypothetical protein
MKGRVMLLGMGLAACCAAARAQQPPPSAEAIKAMREELQAKQRQHERLSDRKELIPLQPLAALPFFDANPRFAYLRLTNSMDALRAIWTLAPAPAALLNSTTEAPEEATAVDAAPDASGMIAIEENAQAEAAAATTSQAGAQPAESGKEPVVVPLVFRGDQWLRLEAGAWLLQMETGAPGSDHALSWAPRLVQLKAGRAYALEMNEATERQLRKLLTAQAKRAELAAKGGEPAPEDSSPEPEAAPAP